MTKAKGGETWPGLNAPDHLSRVVTREVKKERKASPKKCTPGDWAVKTGENGFVAVVDFTSDNEDVLALVDPDRTRAELGESAEANAALMAAAPTLLMACKRIQQWSWSLPHSYREADDWKAVDAAILLAEG